MRLVFKVPEDSFTHRTERRGSCLIWTGYTTDRGYGQIWDGSRRVRVHRWAYEQANGPIPEGMDIDHICGNRLCCEASHLRVATRKQNMENLQGANRNSPSGVRGVHRDVKSGGWRVRVKHNYRQHFGGIFQDLAQAEAAAIALRNRLFTHNDADSLA